jgi:hypothetical protein
MMRSTLLSARYRAWLVCALALVSLLASTHCGNTPTGQRSPALNALTQNPSPRCFGRYLADLPDTLVLNTEHGAVIDGVKVAIDPMEEAKFKLLLQTREAELRNEHMNGEPEVPFLKKIEDTPIIELGKVFNRAETSGAADFGRTLELMAWSKGYVFNMSIDAIDSSDPKYQSHPRIKNYSTDTPEKLRQLLSVYERTRGRADNEIPTEQGICLHRGFIKGPPTDQEEVVLFYNLQSTEDVYFEFRTQNDDRPDPPVLWRGAPETSWGAGKGCTVRKGRQAPNGLQAEEWLVRGLTQDMVMGHRFVLEAHSKTMSARMPLVAVDMRTGLRQPGPALSREESAVLPPLQKAFLCDAEAMALWDAVTATLRPRPGAF